MIAPEYGEATVQGHGAVGAVSIGLTADPYVANAVIVELRSLIVLFRWVHWVI